MGAVVRAARRFCESGAAFALDGPLYRGHPDIVEENRLREECDVQWGRLFDPLDALASQP